jgi:hypothetical protein
MTDDLRGPDARDDAAELAAHELERLRPEGVEGTRAAMWEDRAHRAAGELIDARRELERLRARVAELEAEQLTLENRHRVALARELTAAAGCPLRDRYGFAAYDHDIVTVVSAVFAHPDDENAVSAIGAANAVGEIELAMGSDTPTDEAYERRIVAALRPLAEQRRDAAVRGLS